ncbi:hypothetical protein B0H15DRAFT_874392 [Mycena belliarum]|uniref:Uncharacterized protein n=1 Tax=Mycena belliarum TaxID=1033014 RepID=A0AAD6UHK5_9AGAR|nr:hypothetical protein B0H15DRAFT_874392 [Mycena belliae]
MSLVPSLQPQDAEPDATPPDAPGTAILELRVDSPSIRLYPPPPPTISDDTLAATAMTPGTSSPDTPSLCLLRGTLGDFLQYSRQEASKWLLDLAHDICDPAYRRGSLLVWKDQRWCPVPATDPLISSVYRYDLPAGITVALSKISLRAGKSVSTENEDATAMADRVKRRDGMCWVIGAVRPLSNSHILPKRMGDHLGRLIFGKFTSFGASNLPPPASIYSEVFGVCLTSNLDRYFDTYDMGFRYVSPNIYECHVFTAQAGTVHTIAGEFPTETEMASTLPALHGHPARPPQPQHPDNPPPGLFRWHYLQCVLRKFAHNDYKSLANITYPELPIKMEGDSDDEGTDSEADWPSKGFDLGRQVEDSLAEREERQQAVAQWIAAS